MLRNYKILIISLASVLLAGCATMASGVPPPVELAGPYPERLAILLFDNHSNAVDAPEIIRKLIYPEVGAHHYNLQPLEETETILREKMKITDGGQLPSVTPQELGKELSVDAVLYGTVLEWRKTTTGVFNSYSVGANFKMVECQSGKVLWERTDRVAQGEINVAPERIIAGTVGNLLLNPMTPHAEQLVRKVGRYLPYHP